MFATSYKVKIHMIYGEKPFPAPQPAVRKSVQPVSSPLSCGAGTKTSFAPQRPKLFVMRYYFAFLTTRKPLVFATRFGEFPSR